MRFLEKMPPLDYCKVARAEDPDHMIHFNGERFLGPFPDVMPAKP